MISSNKPKRLSVKARQRLFQLLLFGIIAVFYLNFGCPIKLFTGISCPGCGMSRAVLSLMRFDLVLAFEMHPLVFLLPVAAAVYFARRLIPKKLMTALCVFTLTALITVYIIRMASPEDIISADLKSGLIYRLLKIIFN